MTSYLDKVRQSSELSRRNFLKASAAATAALAAGGLAGCSPNEVEQVADDVSDVPELRNIVDGTWVSAACWHNCGGRCVNKVLVNDGVVVRQKTDDSHEDSYDYPQIRGCGRGRSQRMQVFSADRIKYPMKRKHWEPLTGGDKAMRGRDEWERISWDEALDYAAEEIKHVVDKYGHRSIYCSSGDEMFKTLALNGGFTYSWGTSSVGNWKWAMTYGLSPIGMEGNDRYDLFNSDYVVMIGTNPAWSSAGNPSWYYMHLRDAGIKFIAVDPYYNESYDMLDAEWIPVYPGSDSSLLIGVAYTMITEDSDRGLIDYELLKKCSVGFDADTMPEGSDPQENFKDYVLGTFDGVPKTPEWASEHCGAEPDSIRNLAYVLGKQNNVSLISSFSAARTINGEYYPQLFMTIGLMGGHIGKSGNCMTVSNNWYAGNTRTNMFQIGDSGLPAVPNPVDDKINDLNAWESILKGKYRYTGASLEVPGEEREIDIHMILYGGLNGYSRGTETGGMQTKPNMGKAIEVRHAVDFVLAIAYTFSTDAKYSDIILPATTEWERPGRLLNQQHETLIVYRQVCEPLYEAKSDQWIAIELAKKLGLDPSEAFPISETQQYFNQLAGTKVITEDATGFEPLISITQEDIDEWGVEGIPQNGKIGLKELLENGTYQISRKSGDVYSNVIGYKSFIDDPETNPRKTASGKFEIHSEALRKMFANTGYGNGAASAIPIWQPVVDGHEGTFTDWENKVKGDYPFQVFNPHYLRRSHSTFDNIGWLRKAFAHPVFINASDANDKGIKTGDTVLVWNDNGKTLRQASVTSRLMPGVIALPHGGWLDFDSEKGIDRGGADNMLCGSNDSISGVIGWNTCLVDFEKYDGESLIPDVEKPQAIALEEAADNE